MSEADKIIESLKNSGRKVEEFYTGNKTSDKNVANIEDDVKEYKINLSQKQSMELLKDTLNKFEIRGEQLYLLKIAIENILADYTRQKQINEEHQKINGELREKVKELEEENKKKSIELICLQDELDNSIPKQVVKEVLQNNRNGLFGMTYLSKEQYKTCEMQIKRINKIEQELLGGEK